MKITEIVKIQYKNKQKHENLRMSQKNQENHENHEIPIENQ